MLSITNPEAQKLVGTAYDAALKNLLETNTVPYDGRFNSTGFLPENGSFFRAGGSYALPWTRDAAVNSWNAGSQLAPDVARNTLWAVVQKEKPGDPGSLIVQQIDIGQEHEAQWWDQVVWIVAAWNHYLITGDKEFLRHAYVTAVNTLERRHSLNFNSKYGLYQGASFFNDGIAGYPASIAGTESHGTFVDGDGGRSYPKSRTQMALSTNALYYQAYLAAAEMADQLGLGGSKAASFRRRAAELKKAINRHLWDGDKGTYGYTLVKRDGEDIWELEKYQEGSGVAFALMFDIAEGGKAEQVREKTSTMPWGITDVYPHFPRYSDEKPGRHNNIVWPMVQGFWAQALADHGDQQSFTEELLRLARLYRNSGDFAEIYDATTGAAEGGWQAGNPTSSQPQQTWSASAYLRMVLTGVFGIHYTTHGIRLSPTLPTGWGDSTLSNFIYRKANLTIRLHGRGNKIRTFLLDGQPHPTPSLSSSLEGSHTLDITLEEAAPKK